MFASRPRRLPTLFPRALMHGGGRDQGRLVVAERLLEPARDVRRRDRVDDAHVPRPARPGRAVVAVLRAGALQLGALGEGVDHGLLDDRVQARGLAGGGGAAVEGVGAAATEDADTIVEALDLFR